MTGRLTSAKSPHKDGSVALAVHRRVGARFEHRHRLAARIQEGELVEDLLADATGRELEAGALEGGHALRHTGAHEGEGGGGAVALVQSDEKPSVAQYAVGVRVGISGRGLREAKTLVELDPRAHVLDGDAELMKGPEQG